MNENLFFGMSLDHPPLKGSEVAVQELDKGWIVVYGGEVNSVTGRRVYDAIAYSRDARALAYGAPMHNDIADGWYFRHIADYADSDYGMCLKIARGVVSKYGWKTISWDEARKYSVPPTTEEIKSWIMPFNGDVTDWIDRVLWLLVHKRYEFAEWCMDRVWRFSDEKYHPMEPMVVAAKVLMAGGDEMRVRAVMHKIPYEVCESAKDIVDMVIASRRRIFGNQGADGEKGE